MLIITGSSYTRFVCSLDKLLELLGSKCRTMGCNRNCTFTHQFIGCCVAVTGLCGAGHAFAWASSHTETMSSVDRTNRAGGRIFSDNLEIASSLVVSGNNFSKIEMFFTFLKMPIFSHTTFYSYQRSFILKGINNFFQAEQVEIYSIVYYLYFVFRNRSSKSIRIKLSH